MSRTLVILGLFSMLAMGACAAEPEVDWTSGFGQGRDSSGESDRYGGYTTHPDDE